MPPEPIYRPAHLRSAFQLRYGWTGWPSKTPFQISNLPDVLAAIAPQWEADGLRVLESTLSPEQIQLTLSASPKVSPVMLASRVKGRIEHYCRGKRIPIDFSRKLAVRSLGDATRAQIETYVRNQVVNEAFVDERFRELMTRFTVVDPRADLSHPTETQSGRYWYNLHIVLVASHRYRVGDSPTLAKIRDTSLRICAKKGYVASTLAVLPDHLHIALRGDIAQSPETIALSFRNNLAHVLDQRPMWNAGYYAGTFSEYGMAAVRPNRSQT